MFILDSMCMVESHKQLQETNSNEIFASVSDTFKLGMQWLKDTLFKNIAQPQPNLHTETKSIQNNYKQWQLTPDLAKREEEVSSQRE